MERNRESMGRRTLGAGISSSSSSSSVRRPPPPPPPRTKDGSDDEERMDEMAMEQPRAWERPRKERISSTIHLPSSSSLNPRSKRRRHTGFSHESHVSGRLNVRPEDAEESAEDTEMAASEDEDEPPPPPPLIRRPLKPRTHPKEDEMVMDIPSVPRKARSSISSSSRFSSVSRKPQEAVRTDTIRNKFLGPTQPSLNGSSSPVSLHKPEKRLKPVTPKFRAVKVPKASEASAISDQEAEVAEALFSLAWSTPSQSGLMELKPEASHDMEDRTATPAAATNPIEQIGNASNSHLRDSAKSSIEAPRRKRPRVVIKQEEGKLPTPSQSSVPLSASSLAVKTEPEPSFERSQNLPTDVASVSSECLKDKDILNPMQPQLLHSEEKNQHEVEVSPKEVIAEGDGEIGDQQSVCADTIKVLSNGKDAADTDVDIPLETKSLTTIDLPNSVSRCVDDPCDNNGEVTEGKIDLMRSAAEDDAPGTSVPKPSSGNDTSIHSTNQSAEASKYTMDEPPKASVKDMNDAPLNCKEWINEGKQQEPSAQLYESQETEHQVSQIIKAPKEENEYSRTYSKSQKEDTDNGVSSSFVSSTPSTGPTSLGWIGGIPQMGYYGPGATGWIAGASIPSPNDVVKVTHPNMQLPHTTILAPVPRMKRCATHVYIAHFIYHAQQVSRHSLWSAALCRTPYNLNIPPVNIHDNEKHGAYVDVTRKASAQQPGPSYGYTIAQSSTPGTSGAGATSTVSASNHAAGTGNIDHGNNAAPSNVMAAHAHQYLQAMMQQNGFATFPFPFNGPSGQAAQFFNSPFFPPHMMPPLPQLQPLPQVGSGLPAAQQQQVSLPHQSSSSQQLQLQVAPPSPSSSQQQHSHLNNSASHFGSLIERDSSVGGGNTLSTTDGRLSAMQRNMCDQGGPSNLPNLNMSPKLATSISAIRSHDQDVSSGGKQNTSKSQFQSQAQALPIQQQQYMQQNTGPGMNQPTQGYTSIMVSGATRATTGSPRGLVNVAPLMTTHGHGLQSGSAETTRMHVQQQQIYGAHNSQYQRAMTKGSSSNEEAVVYAVKGRDQNEDKKVSSGKQQLGSLPHISRVDMEVSSPSGSSGRLNNSINIGRTPPTSTMSSDTRNTTKPISSVGIVGQQAPILQSQQQSKQSTSRTKGGLATNAVPLMPNHVNIYGYVDKPPIHGDATKFAGTGVPFSSQTISSSQGNSKQNAHHGNMMKNGQKQSTSQQAASPISAPTIKSQGQQQARNNINNNNSSNMNQQQQAVATSTTSKMMPSVSALPTMPSGSLPIGTSHLLSGPKSAVGSVSKSPSNGKGANSMATKSAPSTKKPSLTGSVSLTSSIGSMPHKAAMTATTTAATTQQKNQAVMHTQQFTQQHPSHLPTQPAKMANKSTVFPQQGQQYKEVLQQQSAPYRPPFFLQHQQQYLPSSSPSQQQQQPHSQHLQPASQHHHYQQHSSNIATQHGQTQQQLRPDSHALQHLQKQQIPVAVASPVSNNGGGFSVGSSNLTLGTNSATLGNKHSDLSSDGADQFKGQHDRANISRSIYNSAGVITSAPREMPTTAHPPVSGQVSPRSSSSQFLQPSTMKSLEQKLSSDVTREEISNAPPQITVAASNPLS